MATTEPITSAADLSYEALAALTEPRLVTEIPGPHARAVIEADARVTSPSLPRAYPLAPERGAGSILQDVDGNAFLDLNAAIAVSSTGHAHPKVVAAIREEAGRLLHYSASDFYLPIYGRTCEVLGEIAPMSAPTRSFLTNSGTEAVEASIKLARHHTGRQYVIAFIGAFHGRSYGSVSLTASNSKYHEGFGPLLPGVVHAPFGADDTDRYIENVIFKRLVKPNEIARDRRRAHPGRGRLHDPARRLAPVPARPVHPARHPVRRRRDPVGHGPHRPDVGRRPLGRRARHRAGRQGHRQRDAARRP